MRTLVICMLALCSIIPTQVPADEQVNLAEVSSIDGDTEALVEQLKLDAKDNVGRSPLTAMLNLRKAAIAEDWQQAAKYADTRYLDKDIAAIGGPELVRRLALVWNQQRIIDLSSLSDSPEGHLDDGLPSYRDLLGTIESKMGEVPIYIQRVPDGSGAKVWRISNASLSKVPKLWEEFGYPPWADSLEQILPDIHMFYMKNWQLLVFVLLLVFLWLALKLLAWPLLRLPFPAAYAKACRYFIDFGLRYFIYFKLLAFSINYLGLSIRAKAIINPALLHYCGVAVFGIALIELATAIYMQKGDKQRFSVAVARPLATTLKILLVLVLFLMWMKGAGFNISAVLAGLGIGSLAVALAAQKTLENVFGAFTLYVARPIKPGDFCRFGDVVGTVEEIGLRSTLIRKLDRTIVYIPNSEFSAKHLENFASIDRRHYRKLLRLTLDSPPEKISALVAALLNLLEQNDKVLEVARRVHLENIEQDAFVVVVNAYLDVVDFDHFKQLEEALNMAVIEAVAEHGMRLAVPQTAVQLEGALAAKPG
ncbi:mechanosensitive ion channel family protein [Agaribacterium haliotis]|uniref:mechanosensitive ion channel family protein n=1 Tax=Agaribacterium haliotis TaxID=2013869 RepID=UPI00117880CD|nr:mechanosensitive ion channel domain-containing protein [Agaribacterium haliotis]